MLSIDEGQRMCDALQQFKAPGELRTMSLTQEGCNQLGIGSGLLIGIFLHDEGVELPHSS